MTDKADKVVQPEVAEQDEDDGDNPKAPKKRYALIVAYHGGGYQGLQANPGM